MLNIHLEHIKQQYQNAICKFFIYKSNKERNGN